MSRSSIKEDKELNRLEQAILDIKKDFGEYRNLYIAAFIGLFILSMVISSWMGQEWRILLRQQKGFYITGLFTVCFSSPYMLVMTLGIYCVAIVMAYRGRKLMYKDYVRVEDDGEVYMLSKETPYSDTHWQTKTEMSKPNPVQDGEVLCTIDKDYNNHTGDILGITKDGEIVSLHMDVFLKNFNKLCIGSAGSGKSAAGVINDLMASLLREESIIVTDTKGDLYRDTRSIFKEHGYLIRVINFKPEELQCSDGWEVMKYITPDDPIQAEVISLAIILNTLDTNKRDYWDKSEQGALKATILLVATSPVYEGRRSFSEVIDIIAHPSEFETKFAGLPRDNPARIAFDNFMEAEERNRGQILQGLGSKLSLLNDPKVKQIVSNDEVDLTLPAKRKCIYYVIMSDTDTTMRFVIAMFFAQIFQAQCKFIDSQPKEVKKKKLKKIRYIIDEAKAVGTIPDYDVKISTFRSRKIYCTMFFQDFGQLADTYPGKTGKGWHDIVANSAIKILFAAGDPDTAKFFQDLIGETTVKVINGGYHKGRTTVLDVHDDEGIKETLNKRYLLPAAKAIHLPGNRIIICIDGHQPIKLNKYLGDKMNPVYLALSKETPPNRHKPKWRKLQEQRQKELKERLETLNEGDRLIAEEQAEEKQPIPENNTGGRLAKAVKNKGMTVTFENGDEVDVDTGEVLTSRPAPRKDDIFDKEPFKEKRSDVKSSKTIAPPDTGNKIAERLNKKYLKGDNILGDLLK